MYGESNEVLIYTYKNIGLCYLALSVPEKAEENYLKALDLMKVLKVEHPAQDVELLKEDNEQMAAIYFNLYLSSVANNEKEKAKAYNLKALELNTVLYGLNSL